MRVCIVSIVNLKHMSGASQYIKFFETNKIKYDIIYIDKYGIEESNTATNIYKYNIRLNNSMNKFHKTLKYIKFYKFAQEVLRENNYDLIISWGTETAFLLSPYLLVGKKKKFINNIRDYANLKGFMKRTLIKILVEKSVFTTISSKGFRQFLPNNEYIIMNSFNEDIINKATTRSSFRAQALPLRICFIGNVRFYENDKKLIDSLANDDRFILQYFGVGSEYLEEYCTNKKIMNVEFVGSFNIEETSSLLNRADIINNLYGVGDIALDTAVSLKYFYSIFLKIPILVFQNTYMEKVASGISYPFNNDYSDLGNRIYNWYHNLNYNEFSERCHTKKEKLYEENQLFQRKLKEVFLFD